MKRYVLLLAVLLFSAAATMNADVMVFDRGLPTSNLNDAAGADRSNVSWGFGSPWDGYNWAAGDDFSLAQAATITDLRVWILGTDSQPLSAMWSDLTLFGGGATYDTVGVLSTANLNGSHPNVTITPTTYADGSSYQATSGNMVEIWQVDFLLNWTVSGGAINTFFVGGTPTQLNSSIYTPLLTVPVSPLLSASNAALSGSTQQGADNQYLGIGYDASNNILTDGMWAEDSGTDGTWDKSSDINVQVFVATPEPSAWVLMGTLLLSLGFLVRRRYQ